MGKRHFIGIELGSTRIKAVEIDSEFSTVSSGSYTWKSDYINGLWTYSLDEVWRGLKTALEPFRGKSFDAAGISGMMHGYIALDEEWNLLVPFRTWQNTVTAQAAEQLTEAFGFNVPQRWSIAHLYQALLNGEEHTARVAHITTLAGYVHYMLTGVNAIGIGEASGMFPIDSGTMDYDEAMAKKFNALAAEKGFTRDIREVLPRVLPAGAAAGQLTERGAELIGGALRAGTPFVPCEGDAGTGMVATNSVAPRTGNVSAGTSIFSMVVLDRPLRQVYEEIDMVTTPAGRPVAMVHCNNCTSDMNAWVGVFSELLDSVGANVAPGDLFTLLYNKSLEGEADCGGLTVFNYLAGEGVTHLDKGCPLVIRTADSRFTLANFIRAQLYATMSTLMLGMNILAEENVVIDRLTGHGGLFKTPTVGQKYMAAACGVPITCMSTAAEGGPYGMALLAAYSFYTGMSLEDFLAEKVFSKVESSTLAPDECDAAGFKAYLSRFAACLPVEEAAVDSMK